MVATTDFALIVQAATAAGDRWLCADSVAVVLGMFTPSGLPNRRGFLERVAPRGSFPRPLSIGSEKKWRKSEVEQWAADEQEIQSQASGIARPLPSRAAGGHAAAPLSTVDDQKSKLARADASAIPFDKVALGVEEVGILLGLSPRTVLEKVACRPDFPTRLTNRPATWVAGEVLEWRDGNRNLPKGRRPRSQKEAE